MRDFKFSTLFTSLGEQTELYERVTTGKDGFNNPDFDWTYVGDITVIWNYPDDVYQAEQPEGEYEVDSPEVYIREEEWPDVENSRLKRVQGNGKFYELQAGTLREGSMVASVTLCRDTPPVEKQE